MNVHYYNKSTKYNTKYMNTKRGTHKAFKKLVNTLQFLTFITLAYIILVMFAA